MAASTCSAVHMHAKEVRHGRGLVVMKAARYLSLSADLGSAASDRSRGLAVELPRNGHQRWRLWSAETHRSDGDCVDERKPFRVPMEAVRIILWSRERLA